MVAGCDCWTAAGDEMSARKMVASGEMTVRSETAVGQDTGCRLVQ